MVLIYLYKQYDLIHVLLFYDNQLLDNIFNIINLQLFISISHII